MELNKDDLWAYLQTLAPDDQVKQIDEWRQLINNLEYRFRDKYTYCTGCHKYVERNAQHREPDTRPGREGVYLLKCNACNTTWKYEEALKIGDLVTDGEYAGYIIDIDEEAQTAEFEYMYYDEYASKDVPLIKLRRM